MSRFQTGYVASDGTMTCAPVLLHNLLCLHEHIRLLLTDSDHMVSGPCHTPHSCDCPSLSVGMTVPQ